jgi:hypothetical protein
MESVRRDVHRFTVLGEPNTIRERNLLDHSLYLAPLVDSEHYTLLGLHPDLQTPQDLGRSEELPPRIDLSIIHHLFQRRFRVSGAGEVLNERRGGMGRRGGA